jgi:hypothetical protein
MEQPNSKFKTMGTSAAKDVSVPSAKPERGTLVKKKNTAAGDSNSKKGKHALKHATAKRAYGITTTMPSYKDPQIGPTQGNGKILPASTNRTSVQFTDGMSDHN